MCELYGMYDLHLNRVGLKNKTNCKFSKEDYGIQMKRIVPEYQSTHCFTEMNS